MRSTILPIPPRKGAEAQQIYLPITTITLNLNEMFLNKENVNEIFENVRIGEEESSNICGEILRKVR